MGFINMMAIGAAVPEAAFDATLDPILFGGVLAMLAIAGLLMFGSRRASKATPILTLARPAFGAAH